MPSEPTGREHLTPVAIKDTSATERAGFRKCRRRWFLETVHRLDPQEGSTYTFIGNLFHKGLQTFYEMRRDHPTVPHQAMVDVALDSYEAEFDALMLDQKDQHGFLWSVAEPIWHEAGTLGFEMLQNYLDREAVDPLLDEIIAVEFRVRVPIKSPKGRRTGWLSVQTDLVGRKDGVLKAVDHKTRGRRINSAHLDIDDQLTAEVFSWWRHSGEWPERAVYNVAYRKAPHPPKQVKGTKKEPVKLSKAKDQGTTYQLYREEIEKLGLDKSNYVDILAHLKELDESGENVFFEREETFRTMEQMAAFERDLYWEFRDMKEVAKHPERAYPSPSDLNCSGCPVRTVCTTIQDDGDVAAIIKAGFVIADPRR